MSALGKLCRLNVTAMSPNQRVRASATLHGGVRVAIAAARAPDEDGGTLAEQVAAAVNGALRGMRSGEEEILLNSLSELDDGSDEHRAMTQILREFRAPPPKVSAAATSRAGNVKMKMDGHGGVTVGIKTGSEKRLTDAELVREIDEAVAAVTREHARRVKGSTSDDR